ncbi:FG-GAP-like repeat-containing protein [Amycolatopsis jejuensis]|uniref:FG-GAP-like repeat-containing protein n=1 Tax=Amycolatopsis jejuensis TaxID=330084 RepID=UPI0005251D4D|nr:FG-GAP-like repeat-containing protein [Amycolatopsis jejuensis]
MLLRRLLAVLALAVSPLVAVPPSAGAAALGPAVRIMPLGDSITAGAGSATVSSYRAPLWTMLAGESRYSPRFVGTQTNGSLPGPANEGHSGYTIDQITAGIGGWLAFDRPDVVLLHIGINDLDRGIDIANAPARLHRLLDRIYADRPDVTVLLLGLIPTSAGLESRVAAYNSAVKGFAAGENQAGHRFRYVEPPALTSGEMQDHLHPNDAGYRRMAESFSGALAKAYSDGLFSAHPPLGAATESGGSGKIRWADFDGDGRADYVTIASNGAVNVFLNRGGDGHGGWQALGQVATGLTTDPARVRLADFDGDGRADYLLIAPNGAVSVYLNRGGDGHGGWQALGQVATGLTTDPSRVRFADFDGDGRTDYLLIAPNGVVTAYLNRGGDGHGGWLGRGQVAGGTTTDANSVRFADLDGDARADYVTIAPSGAVNAFFNRGGDEEGGWQSMGQVATGVTTDSSAVALADFTGGGNADYLLLDKSTNAASVYSWEGGDGHGSWNYRGTVAGGVPVS